MILPIIGNAFLVLLVILQLQGFLSHNHCWALQLNDPQTTPQFQGQLLAESRDVRSTTKYKHSHHQSKKKGRHHIKKSHKDSKGSRGQKKHTKHHASKGHKVHSGHEDSERKFKSGKGYKHEDEKGAKKSGKRKKEKHGEGGGKFKELMKHGKEAEIKGYKDKQHKDEDKKLDEFYNKYHEYGADTKYGHHRRRVYHHVEDMDKGKHKKKQAENKEYKRGKKKKSGSIQRSSKGTKGDKGGKTKYSKETQYDEGHEEEKKKKYKL